MTAEAKITPARFSSEIEDISQKIQMAVAKTGLPSTQGLCHYINYSIALRLKESLQLPLTKFSFELETANSAEQGAIIAYVPWGQILTHSDQRLIPHSFPLVLGIQSSPVLIDGANDQGNPTIPFLTQQLEGPNYYDIKTSLRRHGHPKRDIGPSLETTITDRAETLLRIVRVLKGYNIITPDAALQVEKQAVTEAQAGITFLSSPIYNRDWIFYFTKALGVDYPSTQNTHEAVYSFLNHSPSSLKPDERKMNMLVGGLL